MPKVKKFKVQSSKFKVGIDGLLLSIVNFASQVNSEFCYGELYYQTKSPIIYHLLSIIYYLLSIIVL